MYEKLLSAASLFEEKTAFNLDNFKKLHNLEEIQEEAEKLPFLGRGSSRNVYDLGDKVLKVIREGYLANHGINQNMKEVYTSKGPAADLVAEIYEYHPEYYWIISEKAPRIEESEEVQSYIGVPPGILYELVRLKKKLEFSPYADKADLIKLNNWEKMIRENMGEGILEKVRKIADALISGDLNIDDIFSERYYYPSQWGKSPRGIKITDYGLCKDK